MNFLLNEKMTGSYYLASFTNFLIISPLFLGISALFLLVLVMFMPKISKSSTTYFYSLTTASLLVIGTFGFYTEAVEKINDFLGIEEHSHAHAHAHGDAEEMVSPYATLLKISVFAIGATIGGAMFLLLRYLLCKKIAGQEVHVNHSNHDHSDLLITKKDLDNPRKAWVALLLILMHRSIDGFFFGSVISKLTLQEEGYDINWGFVLSFIVHSLFDIMVIYYHQVNYGETSKRALYRTLISVVLLLPTLLLGALIYPIMSDTGWILPIVNVAGGTSLTIAAIVEFVPEFIHMRNEKPKYFMMMLIWFVIGVILTTALLQSDIH